MRFYLLILAIATGAGGYWYGGHVRDIYWQAETETAINEAVAAAMTKERALQHEADKIAQRQADELHSVNERLTVELDRLRNRPSRRDLPRDPKADKSCGTGAGLLAEDAIFLARLAASAERHRVALKACYAYADSLQQ